jgi:hypothetical protein
MPQPCWLTYPLLFVVDWRLIHWVERILVADLESPAAAPQAGCTVVDPAMEAVPSCPLGEEVPVESVVVAEA